MKKNMTKIIIAIIAVLVILSFIIFPPSLGKMTQKSYIDTGVGNIGIYLFEDENINNGADNKPVLLVCGGGPGISQYFLEHEYKSRLTDYFNVCYFDYRGTGLSYDKSIDSEDMTTKRYLQDVEYITDYLIDRYGQKKIYIMGHSFGTYIALKMVSEQPEKYRAYLAMSQNTNQVQSEYRAYDYMKAKYEELGNTSMVNKLEKYNIKESSIDYKKYFSSGIRDKAMHELGVGTTRNMKSVIKGIFFPSLRIREYSPRERINFWKGKAASASFVVTNESIGFNAFEEVKSIEIPIYFFAGKYDYTCSYELQKEYFDFINAPYKEFFSFDNSAHSPIYEEPDLAAEYFKKIIEE